MPNFQGINTTIKRTYQGVVISMYLECEGDFDPGYPAPPCSNPSSAAFSDPGAPPELEIHKSKLVEFEVWEYPEHFANDEEALIAARAAGFNLKVGDHVPLTDDEHEETYEDLAIGAQEYAQGEYEAAMEAQYDLMKDEGNL